MKEQIVLITGCSTGIGRNLAEWLTRAGYIVVATARRTERLADLPAALKLPLDVTSPESVKAAVDAVLGAYGRIDVLINNAGYGQLGPLEEVTEEGLRRVFEVNVYGLVRMVQAVLPHMRAQGSGRIINLSSLAGRFAAPFWGPYSGTKFAVEAMSDSLRAEVAPFGIKVVVIQPPAIRTNFEDTARTEGAIRPESPYRKMYEKIDRIFTRMNQSAPGPEAVSQVIERAIKVSRPRPRYQVTIPAVLTARLLLPLLSDRFVDWAAGKVLRG